MIRILSLMLYCSLCGGKARRMQTSSLSESNDYNTIDASQNAQSLIQLVQSGMSPIDTVKHDFLSILRKEPTWKKIAKYLMVTDQAGYTSFGVKSSKWLCKILRRAASTFVLKDFKVDFVEEHVIVSEWRNGKAKKESHTTSDQLLAQWSIKLDTKMPWFHSGEREPILIEGETQFVFNQDMQLSHVRMMRCFVNGMQLASWPEMQSSDSFSTNMGRIREWIEAVKEYTFVTGQTSTNDDAQTVLDVGELPYTGDNAIEAAMRTLKADFANIFYKEPTWNIFAQNLTMTDHAGHELPNIEAHQNLLQLLRKLPEQFVVRDFFVNFFEETEIVSTYSKGKLKGKAQMPFLEIVEGQEGSFLLATWKLTLGDKKKKHAPLEIEAGTYFQLNLIDEQIKIDRITISAFYVNGKALETWPEVDLLDLPENAITIIRDWADGVAAQTKEVTHEQENSADANQ